MRVLFIIFVSTFALLTNTDSNAEEYDITEYNIVKKSSNVMEWVASSNTKNEIKKKYYFQGLIK